MKPDNGERKQQLKHSAQPAGSAAKQKEGGNVEEPTGRDSRQALIKMMKMTVEKFYSIQNHECPIMAELLRQGLAGKFRAGKRIMDIVEGQV